MKFSTHKKTSPKNSMTFLLTLLLFMQISSCFHWDGNMLYDLETNTQSGFTIETADWTLSNYRTPGVKFYNCANNFVMGGHGVLGGTDLAFPSPTMQDFRRTYSSLPVHNQIYLQMRFYQLGTWDLGDSDYFSIGIDGASITGWKLDKTYAGAKPLCGISGHRDFVFTLSLAYPHSASSLTLRMISYTNENTLNESFGFRDIKIEFLTVTNTYTSLCAPDPGDLSSYLPQTQCRTSCGAVATGNSIQPVKYGFCFPSSSCSTNCKRCSTTTSACTSCPTGSFLVGTTCYPACDYPLSKKLLGGVTYCETPCPGKYAWWDGTCSSPCSYTTAYSPLAIVGRTFSTFQVCTYPCATNQYLYWNTSCLSSCPSPLLTTTYKSRKFCEYPCASSGYLYWNGSCLSTCPSPLSSETQGTSQQRKFCWYTCPQTQYLYWNGSCSSACPYPLIPETQSTSQPRKFCWYPCQPSEYLYWNGSCLSTCPSPLSSETQGTSQQLKFCWYTCPETQYLYWNGSCSSTCPSPLIPETQSTSQPRNFCWYPCQPSEYLYWNGSCIQTCPSPLSSETQGISQQRKFCWYTCPQTQYLYWNGSCSSACPYPLMPETQSTSQPRKFCWYPCQPSEYLHWNRSCISSCPSPLSPEIQGVTQQRNFCWSACPETQYLYWNGSCLNTCPYPLEPEIQQGVSSSRKFCWYPCLNTEFLYWNGSCINDCPSPLAPEVQGTIQQRNFCWSLCAETQFLYWNESCIDNCPSPLTPEIQQGVSSSRNFCWYSCQPSKYLYWNGSCINNCPSPLSPETQGTIQQRNFCWYTCDVNEYLYWNQSCSSHCPIPLVSFDISGNLFCFLPCSMPNIYWYQDLACRKECNFPYVLLSRDSVYQCLKPCSRPSEYFYDLEKECHDTCEHPYVRQLINEIKVCHITSSTLSSEIEMIEKTAGLLETLGQVTSTILKAVIIPELSSSRSPLLVQLSTLIQYIRYMRINYPWRLRLLFEANGAKLISLNFDFSIPNWIQGKLDDYPLPDVFEKYDLESNFINNLWDLMTTALLVIFVLIGLLLLRRLLKKYHKICHIITRILQSLQWNTLLALICADSGEIIFYASLHIQNTPLGSPISIVSLIITLSMIFSIIVILGICFKILRGFRARKQKRAPSKTQDWLEKWKGYETLYEEIGQESLFSLAYMIIYITRATLFFAIIANLYDYPLAQSILINVINVLIFGYLLYFRPLQNRLNIIQLFINELLGDIQVVCVFALAKMDREKTDDPYARFTLGNIIIVIIVLFYVLGLVFLAIEGVLFSIKAYKTWKEMRAQGIRNPFKMIKILLFEELSKANTQKIILESSQNSSMLHLNATMRTFHFGHEYFQEPHSNNKLPSVRERRTRRPRIHSEAPSHLSPKRFTPFRDSKFHAQSTRFEAQASRPNRMVNQIPEKKVQPRQNNHKERIVKRNTSGLILQDFEPPFRPNVNFIEDKGNPNTRIKRLSRPGYRFPWAKNNMIN